MAAFVLDAAVAVSWCFRGDPLEDTVYNRQVLKQLALGDALVAEISTLEIAQRDFCFPRKAQENNRAAYLTLLKAPPIRVEGQDIWANVDLESVARAQNVAAMPRRSRTWIPGVSAGAVWQSHN